MTQGQLPRDERLLDLLAERATRGLGSEQEADLERLLAAHPGTDEQALDLAAAAADLALAVGHGRVASSLPPDLRARVVADADVFLGRETPERPPRRGLLDPRWMGWYAAAAMLILAVLLALRGDAPQRSLTALERRQQFLSTVTDPLRVAWQRSDQPGYENVSGEVVWSDELQAGFLTLRGLPANDPDREQYQLWIVDPDRDTNPVDGGVFDVPSGPGEVVIPIDAKLQVDRPAAFAVTLEPPGGVVVSDGPLLVVAPVDA